MCSRKYRFRANVCAICHHLSVAWVLPARADTETLEAGALFGHDLDVPGNGFGERLRTVFIKYRKYNISNVTALISTVVVIN